MGHLFVNPPELAGGDRVLPRGRGRAGAHGLPGRAGRAPSGRNHQRQSSRSIRPGVSQRRVGPGGQRRLAEATSSTSTSSSPTSPPIGAFVASWARPIARSLAATIRRWLLFGVDELFDPVARVELVGTAVIPPIAEVSPAPWFEGLRMWVLHVRTRDNGGPDDDPFPRIRPHPSG